MLDMYVVLTALVLMVCVKELSKRPKLNHIPTVGYLFPLLSYISAYKYYQNGRAIIEEGQRKYPTQVWKVATFDGWFVIANGTQRLEEISKAPEDQLSAGLSFQSYMQLDYTLGPEVISNPYHVTTIRTSMTRNIGKQFEDMRDEMLRAFDDVLPSPTSVNGEWVGVKMFESVLEIWSRISARLAIGYPLCGDKEFRDLCTQSGHELMKGRSLRYLPRFLKPIAAKYLGIHEALRLLAEHLRPLIEYRLEQEHLHGRSWAEKPSDLLTWCMEEAEKTGAERTPLNMAKQIYFISFASHVSSVIFMYALHELATRPEYVQPLRDEIVDAVGKDGWTKTAFGKMRKLDSFLREIQRCHDTQLLHLGRKVVKDFAFSDGTVVPAGSILYVNSHGVHHDETLYPNPYQFDGFRYVCMDAKDDLEVGDFKERQPLMSRPTLEYIAFGYGKHACPGRFIATHQLKAIFAHLIMSYDIKADSSAPPPGLRTESEVSPDLEAMVFLRARSTSLGLEVSRV